MPNLTSVLNDQIWRLARREITANTKVIKRATAHYRRDIAALTPKMLAPMLIWNSIACLPKMPAPRTNNP
jgi:hypothetical protein